MLNFFLYLSYNAFVLHPKFFFCFSDVLGYEALRRGGRRDSLRDCHALPAELLA
jgi:hypothetical protein